MTSVPLLSSSRLRAQLVAVAVLAAAGSAAAQTALERGRYLVTTILACGNCHTPKDSEGRALPGRELAGGGIGFDIPPFAGVAANITPDNETGIGTWSDAEIKRAITHGERPARGPLAGKPLARRWRPTSSRRSCPATSMPSSPTCARCRRCAIRCRRPSIAARSSARRRPGRPRLQRGRPAGQGAARCLPGDDRSLPRVPHPGRQGRPATRDGVGRRRTAVPAVVRQGPAGRVAGNGVAQPPPTRARPRRLERRRDQARHHQGVGRDGRRMQEPMPYAWYAGLRDDDLDAIVAYLRTLPALAR